MSKSSRRTRRRFAQIGSGTSLCLCYRLPRTAVRLPDALVLSREAKQRLKILAYVRTHSVAATCRHFGIARSKSYRWAKRYDPQHRPFLENRSSRPRRVRRPTWTPAQAQAVQQARKAHPRWGKDKLAVVLNRTKAETVSRLRIMRVCPPQVHLGSRYSRRCGRPAYSGCGLAAMF